MTQPAAQTLEALALLRSKKCWCDRHKLPGDPFCGTCYRVLSTNRPDLRQQIARRGTGFMDCRAECVAFLRNWVRVLKPLPCEVTNGRS